MIESLVRAGRALDSVSKLIETTNPVDVHQVDRVINQASLTHSEWKDVHKMLVPDVAAATAAIVAAATVVEGFSDETDGCVPGATDIGVGCLKFKDTYTRNIGDPLSSCPEGKEKGGALCYNKCRDGYNGVASVCWQSCPSGFTDYGTGCSNLKITTKDNFTRGVGTVPESCPSGKDKSGALCYDACKAGYKGVANTCTKECPSGYTDTGLTCTSGGVTTKNITNRSTRVPDKGACANGERDDGTSCWSPLTCNTSGCGCIKKTLMDRSYCKTKVVGICVSYGKRDCDADQRDDGTSCWEDAKSHCTGGAITKTLAQRQQPCNSDEETVNTGITKTCTSKCPSGYKTVGTQCYQECPAGYTDLGLTCTNVDVKAKDVYLRDVGSSMTCGNNQEKDAGLCYTRCKEGYSGKGPVCWQNCSTGFTDDGATCRRDDGFVKDTYLRDVGSPMVCPSNKEQQGALCYDRCKDGYNGVLNACWEKCPDGYADTGISCMKFSLNFVKDLKQVFVKIFEAIEASIDRMINAVVGMWNKIEDTLTDFASDTRNKMEDLLSILKPILEFVWHVIKFVTDAIIYATIKGVQTAVEVVNRARQLWIATPVVALGLVYGSYNLFRYLFNVTHTNPTPYIVMIILVPMLLVSTYEPMHNLQDFFVKWTIPVLYKNPVARYILGTVHQDTDEEVISIIKKNYVSTFMLTVCSFLVFKFFLVDTLGNILQVVAKYITEGSGIRPEIL